MFFPILLFFALLLITIPFVQERVVDIFEMSADSSVLWRINIWKDGINQVFVENRFLFGFGLDTFPAVITNLHTQEFGSPDTHNDFVKFFVEGGVVGLLVYIFWMGWFFVRLFLLFFDAKKEKRNDVEMYFIIFIFFLCIGMASLSDAVFKSTPLQWVLWITIGSVLGLEARKKK
jgi:O-antigen ligase